MNPPARALNRKQSREIDRIAIDELGISGLVLMENAGRGCVDHLVHAGCFGPVVICCGTGNNGAMDLSLRGISIFEVLPAK